MQEGRTGAGVAERQQSHRYRRPDGRVVLVAHEPGVAAGEIEYRLDTAVEFHSRKRVRIARELGVDLFQVVEVRVGVAPGVHKFAGLRARPPARLSG